VAGNKAADRIQKPAKPMNQVSKYYAPDTTTKKTLGGSPNPGQAKKYYVPNFAYDQAKKSAGMAAKKKK